MRQRRQASIGDAGVERWHQHGERKAGERPANRRCRSTLQLMASMNVLQCCNLEQAPNYSACLTWRKTHCLHCIRAFDAMSDRTVL